ncbi:MAG: TIGR04372 family glycosyltransferase [Dehalococcoidales bacterium]|nr:TIGR04372 family glycosyltransferase [Dehalococcoidales bacterium]
MVRKLSKFLVMLLFLPFTLPGVLILRVLRPLVLIRFYPFSSEVIGIFAAVPESYLCRRDAGLDQGRTFDIFYHNRQPCNQQLRKMWDRRLRVWNFAGPVDTLNRAIPGGERHVGQFLESADRDTLGLLPRTATHLSFTPEEERLGRDELRAMGIPEGTPFICFHARDSEYKEVMNPESDSHIYSQRDSSIHNHVPAAEEMTHRGYYAIRMGALVKEPLQTTNPMIIDYATKHRSDFMDIYLCAKCYFYIGDDSGLHRVSFIFRRPLANSNQIPIDQIHTQGPNDLIILKKLLLREENRFLTFRNIFDGGFNDFAVIEQYEQAGIEPVEDTPEEITALAVEMDERLKGTWQTTEEDEELQRHFWSLFKPAIKGRHGIIESHIGADFLRRNRELLD